MTVSRTEDECGCHGVILQLGSVSILYSVCSMRHRIRGRLWAGTCLARGGWRLGDGSRRELRGVERMGGSLIKNDWSGGAGEVDRIERGKTDSFGRKKRSLSMNRTAYSRGVLRPLERLLVLGTFSGLSEGDLLARFVCDRDESAFEAIVARHGPMVMGICRRLLAQSQDVDDAFQSTFLVLVKKARSLRDRELLGNWLYGVAVRVAMRARRDRLRRRSREQPVCALTAAIRDSDGEQSRAAIAAGCGSRAAAKEVSGADHPVLLRRHDPRPGGRATGLSGRNDTQPDGQGPRATAVTVEQTRVRANTAFHEHAASAEWRVSSELLARTVNAAIGVTARQSIAAGVITVSTPTLARGAIKTMPLFKMIKIAAIFVAIGAAGGGAGLAARQLGSERAGEAARSVSSPEPIEKAIQALEEARNQIKQRSRPAGRRRSGDQGTAEGAREPEGSDQASRSSAACLWSGMKSRKG